MARFALCAMGLALTGPHSLAAPAPDATALIQMNQAHADASGKVQRHEQDEQEQQWEVEGGLPDEVGYAPEDYEQGETVEAKTKTGEWLPCIVRQRAQGDLWDLHVSDEFPGFDLPAVPAQLLRRRLGAHQSDWYIDNTKLNHKGHGIKYRRSKSLKDAVEDIAPWNSLVVGSDEQDGWVKTVRGYLPMKVKGVPVLARRERPEDNAADFKEDPTLPKYEDSEKVQFKTKGGEWYPAEVIAPGKRPNTYSVVVRPELAGLYPVSDVHASRLRKNGPPAKPAAAAGGMSLGCQDCFMFHLRTEAGKEYLMQASPKMKVQSIMKMACKMVHLAWEGCEKKMTLTLEGKVLNAAALTSESGLKDSDVLDMKLAGAAEEENS